MAELGIRPLRESFTIILLNGHSPRVFNKPRKKKTMDLLSLSGLSEQHCFLTSKAQRSSNKKKTVRTKADLLQNSFD